MLAMYAADLGSTGAREMSRLIGLLAGSTGQPASTGGGAAARAERGLTDAGASVAADAAMSRAALTASAPRLLRLGFTR